MDEQTLLNIIDQQWEVLPAEIQKALSEGEPGNTATTIAESLQLSPEQTEHVVQELYVIMLGLEPFSSLKQNLQKTLGDEEIADAVYSILDIGFLTTYAAAFKTLAGAIESSDAKSPETNPNSLATKIPISKNDGQKAIYNSVTAPEQKAAAAAPVATPPVATMPEMPSLQEAVTGAVQAVENEVVVQKTPVVNIADRPQTPTGTIIDEKLRSIVKTPREEVTVNVPASSYGQNKDPYREPLE